MSRRWKLEQVQFIPKPRSEVFGFFADAFNLERITPAFLKFKVDTPGPIQMKPGAIIDYSLRLYGLPLRWKTRIEVYEPETRFIDVQLNGPYRFWHHLHQFEEVQGGTRMLDLVHYEVPLGPLGTLARELFVRKSLESIFNYRRQAIEEIMGSSS